MANTTNYNWETPDDTDLVKDGAAAIRTLGNSIDTTTKNLNPETTTGDIAYRSATANTNTRLAIGSTGQVLTVAAGVPSWATPTVGDITEVQAGTGISVASGTGPIPVVTNSMATEITAKGDLIVGTGSGTFDNLPAGTNGHILTADSSVSPTGLKWAAPAGSGANWSLLNTGGTTLTGAATITVSGISGADKIMVVLDDASAPASARMGFRLNTNTGSIYYCFGISLIGSTIDSFGAALTFIYNGSMSNNNASKVSGGATFTGCNSSGVKQFISFGAGSPDGGTGNEANWFQGYVDLSATITSISVFNDTGNFDAGKVFVYTSA